MLNCCIYSIVKQLFTFNNHLIDGISINFDKNLTKMMKVGVIWMKDHLTANQSSYFVCCMPTKVNVIEINN